MQWRNIVVRRNDEGGYLYTYEVIIPFRLTVSLAEMPKELNDLADMCDSKAWADQAQALRRIAEEAFLPPKEIVEPIR